MPIFLSQTLNTPGFRYKYFLYLVTKSTSVEDNAGTPETPAIKQLKPVDVSKICLHRTVIQQCYKLAIKIISEYT